jgi:mycobactin lysine-N-oxygenase
LNEQQLIVIGAGPKAMALAAKNHVLARLGVRVPHLHIIERRRVGAHWTGESGYTNGLLKLSTSPEKDIGFPYKSSAWASEEMNHRVDDQMIRFSWQSFLIATGAFSDWIDRGRPAPEHRRWAEYLQWVAEQAVDHVSIHCGEARSLSVEDDRFRIVYRGAEGHDRSLVGDGLVVTGPGQPQGLPSSGAEDRVITADGFWSDLPRFRALDAGRIAIIGSGESAAAVAMELTESGHPELRIDIISPSGTTFSRGESFRENRAYSDPRTVHWQDLSERERRRFIHRTDRGVFSQAAQLVLDQSTNVDVRPGRLAGVRRMEDGRIELDLRGERRQESYVCDFAVLAMGTDHLAVLRGMLTERSLEEILRRTGLPELSDRVVEPLIGQHFELGSLRPRLHLPMLSRVAQGPGFANLSCLGRLSDWILSAYVVQAEQRTSAQRKRDSHVGDGQARSEGGAPRLPRALRPHDLG